MKKILVFFALVIAIVVIYGCAKSTSSIYYTVTPSAGGAGMIEEMHATNVGDSVQSVHIWPYTSPTYVKTELLARNFR